MNSFLGQIGPSEFENLNIAWWRDNSIGVIGQYRGSLMHVPTCIFKDSHHVLFHVC